MDPKEYPDFIDPQQYPNFWEQVNNFKQFAVDVGQGTIKENNPILCSEEKSQERLNTCSECEHFDSGQKRCYLCGCFMEYKVKFTSTTCPASKW